MKVASLLDLIYKRTKDGELSHHAKKFLEKFGVDESVDVEVKDAILMATSISNTEKRNKVVEYLLTLLDNNINLREVTYKQACAFYHPDNVSTGSEVVFKFIQDVKWALWDYRGEVRKHIISVDWKKEKSVDEDNDGLL